MQLNLFFDSRILDDDQVLITMHCLTLKWKIFSIFLASCNRNRLWAFRAGNGRSKKVHKLIPDIDRINWTRGFTVMLMNILLMEINFRSILHYLWKFMKIHWLSMQNIMLLVILLAFWQILEFSTDVFYKTETLHVKFWRFFENKQSFDYLLLSPIKLWLFPLYLTRLVLQYETFMVIWINFTQIAASFHSIILCHHQDSFAMLNVVMWNANH